MLTACNYSISWLSEQPSRGSLKKRCSENLQQIYRKTPMPKWKFKLEIRTPLEGCFFTVVHVTTSIVNFRALKISLLKQKTVDQQNHNLLNWKTCLYSWWKLSFTWATKSKLIQTQPPEVSIKEGVRNFAKLTGKHMCHSLFFNKVAGRTPFPQNNSRRRFLLIYEYTWFIRFRLFYLKLSITWSIHPVAISKLYQWNYFFQILFLHF